MKDNKRKIYYLFICFQVVLLLGVCILPVVKQVKNMAESVLSGTQNPGNKENEKENTDNQEGNVPGTITVEASQAVLNKLATMNMEEKVAQLFIISPEQLTHMGTVTAAGNQTKEAIHAYPVGGLFYEAKNMITLDQVKTMLANVQNYNNERIGLPMFLGVQEEGGSGSPFAGNANFGLEADGVAAIAATEDPDTALASAQKIGSFLADLGFNYNLAPIADLSLVGGSATEGNNFGNDMETVSDMVRTQVTTLKAEGISPVLKYFPGKGSATMHNSGFAVSNQTLEEYENEFSIYIDGINAGADMVMVGHVIAEKISEKTIPASLSDKVITDVLRLKLGYNGLVMTEALNTAAMQSYYTSSQSAVAAFKAGADIIFMPADFEEAYQGIIQAIRDGVITEERLNQSVTRILKAKMGE